MRLEKIVNRRTRELQSSTRSEILVSIGAALLFVVVMVWRFPPAQNRNLELGLGAVVVWINRRPRRNQNPPSLALSSWL